MNIKNKLKSWVIDILIVFAKYTHLEERQWDLYNSFSFTILTVSTRELKILPGAKSRRT